MNPPDIGFPLAIFPGMFQFHIRKFVGSQGQFIMVLFQKIGTKSGLNLTCGSVDILPK